MTDLEDALKLACAKGMTHLTLYPVESSDRKKMYWHARATPSTGHGYVFGTALDPVEAVTTVLKNLPSAKQRAVSKETGRQHVSHRASDPPDEVTATATETPLEPETFDTWLPKG